LSGGAPFNDGQIGLCAVYGCTDTTACNYNSEATDNDGSCEYALEGYDCKGTCLDDDGDGVSNLDENEG
jgi:hypothetical protein